jgi:glutathione synthase/RimK-type ligase-like ATP-grasp enzyme
VRFAFLTPDADYPEPCDWAFDVEAEAVRARGVEVEAVPWTDGRDLSGYDLILPLVAWGYHLRYRQWLSFLDDLQAAGLPVVNPPQLLRWNSDKAYLKELGAQGISSVETIEAAALAEADLFAAAELFGTADLVIKPPVSGGAFGTHRIRAGDSIPASESGQRMMIQPFLPGITTEGEYAIILFGGAYSHTVVKRPKSGDFRVQPHLGGSTQTCEPPSGGVELAEAALAAAPTNATYARVDIVRGSDQQFQIMELELIEPALFLDLAPHGKGAFADAIIAAARTTTAG